MSSQEFSSSSPKEVVLCSNNCFTLLNYLLNLIASSGPSQLWCFLPPLLTHIIFKTKLKTLTIPTTTGSREILSIPVEADMLDGPIFSLSASSLSSSHPLSLPSPTTHTHLSVSFQITHIPKFLHNLCYSLRTICKEFTGWSWQLL